MNPMEAALASLSSLELREKPHYTQVAKTFGVNRSTLSKRHRGVQGTRAEYLQKQQLLSLIKEQELVKYIERLCARGLPPTQQMVRNFASEIAGKQAGGNWVNRFLKRSKVELITR